MIRQVAIDETAVTRAEEYILDLKKRKGERYTLGTIFAKAMNNLIESDRDAASDEN